MGNSCTDKGEKFGYDPDAFQHKLTKELIEKFPNLSEKYIAEVVQLVIDTDARFISKETVKNYYYLCERCGVCCQNCGELKGNLCGIWNKKYQSDNKMKPRKPEICDLWPYFEIPEENHGVQLVIGCPYAWGVIYYELINFLKWK